MLASVPLRCCRRGVASRREIELDAAYEGQAEQTVTANEQQHHRRNVNDRSAAAFLLQEAEREAADEQAAIEAQRASQERILQRTRASGQVTDQTTEMQPAWDGEETQERMIRRILEDQYKPLRIKVSTHSRTAIDIIVTPLSHCAPAWLSTGLSKEATRDSSTSEPLVR